MTVYIIDDDPQILNAMERWLTINQLAVKSFSSAEAFLQQIKFVNQAGCLVLDLRMPGMSGLELQLELKSLAPHWPIIFLTGHGQVHIAMEAVKQGAMDFLEKPIDNYILIEHIQKALQRSQSLVHLKQEKDCLTSREIEIVDWLAFGFSSKEIANELNLSTKTVEYHRANIRAKIDLNNYKKNLMAVR